MGRKRKRLRELTWRVDELTVMVSEQMRELDERADRDWPVRVVTTVARMLDECDPDEPSAWQAGWRAAIGAVCDRLRDPEGLRVPGGVE